MMSSSELPLEPIRSARVSDAAVEQILALVKNGYVEVGDRLPSERELIKSLGVSRTSVREALRMLEALGVLEVQPGRGAFVVSKGQKLDFLSPILHWLSNHQKDLLDIIEVREAIESKAVSLAAQSITEEELRELESAVQTMEDHVKRGDIGRATEADRAFHHLLCRASGNNFLRMLADNIVEALAEPRYSILVVPGRAKMSVNEHRQILEALKSGNSEEAVSSCLSHMTSVKKALSALSSERRQ